MDINNVFFVIRVNKSAKTGNVYYALIAVTPYGEFFVSFDKKLIGDISNLRASDLASLNVGDEIKFS